MENLGKIGETPIIKSKQLPNGGRLIVLASVIRLEELTPNSKKALKIASDMKNTIENEPKKFGRKKVSEVDEDFTDEDAV